MFRFENSDILWFLLFVPVMVLCFVVIQNTKRKKLNAAIDKGLQTYVLPDLSFGKQRLKFIMVMIAFVFIILAAANPQKASTVDNKQRKGCDIMICLDVSNSMLAQDLSPNRLERAKLAISSLIQQLDGDRIGIVLFAGSSYRFLPLTNDYATAKMFTDIIDTKLIDNQGTDIYSALQDAIDGFGKDNKVDNTRTIVLISDGEDLQPQAEDLAKQIAKSNIVINCIGIGSTSGAKIPIKENGTLTYKKDNQGNIVITKLNEQMLKSIASQTGGQYVRASNSLLGLENILHSINKMDKKQYAALAYRDYETIFYIPAIIALIILLIDTIIFNSKNKYINRKFFFGKD